MGSIVNYTTKKGNLSTAVGKIAPQAVLVVFGGLYCKPRSLCQRI